MKVNYDLLERMHKQDGSTADQNRHYELGWEAAIATRGDEWAKTLLFEIRSELRESFLALLADNSHDGPYLTPTLTQQISVYCEAMERIAKEQDG